MLLLKFRSTKVEFHTPTHLQRRKREFREKRLLDKQKRGTKICLQRESQSAFFTLLGFAIAFSWTISVEAGGSSSRDGCVCLRLGCAELV